MRLDELFNDKPYDGEFGRDTSDNGIDKLRVDNVFFTIEDVKYEVRFVRIGRNKYEVNYGYANATGNDRFKPASRDSENQNKSGSVFKVLSKVVSIIDGFIKKVDPETIKFSGEKSVGLNDTYTQMLRILSTRATSLGYHVLNNNGRNHVYFVLTKDKSSVPAHYKPVEKLVKETRLNELFDTKTDADITDLEVDNRYSVGTGKKVNFEVDGVGYEMNFWDEGNNQWTLDYGYSDIEVGKEDRYVPSSITGKNAKNANKVMANVVNGLENFLKKQQPMVVQFTADGIHNLPKLYDGMIKYLSKRLNNLGYDFDTTKAGNYAVYEINKR